MIIALPIATPRENMNSARYVFGTFVNRMFNNLFLLRLCLKPSLLFMSVSEWPDGFAFILSFLSPLWTIGATLLLSIG